MIISLLLLSLPAFAADTLAITCPAVPESYGRIMGQLKELKTSIKREAACDPVREDVASLESLVGQRRAEVMELIEKSKTEPLNENELQAVRDYVESVTKRTFATAEYLSRNNHCFSADRQAFGFGDLAAITLDASTLAKTVAGSWSMPIALGGQALAGIFQGLDKVIKNRRGYDFSKLEQRQNFVQSLCTYHGYRQDMDALLFPTRRYGQIRALEDAVTKNLGSLADGCAECRKIIELKSKAGDDLDGARAAEINRLAAAADASFVKPLGAVTVQSLATLDWARKEVARIRAESGDEFGVGRDMLSEMKAEMDRFVFEREAPQFLKFQGQKSFDLYREFNKYVLGEGRSLVMAAANERVPVDFDRLMLGGENDILELAASVRPKLTAASQAALASRLQNFERKSMELLDRTVLALDVHRSYCSFFQKAGVFSSDLQYACESQQASAVARNLVRMQGTRYLQRPVGAQGPLQPVAALLPESERSVDWVESLTKMSESLSEDPSRFQRSRQ